MLWLVIILILCGLSGGTYAGSGDRGHHAAMPSRYREDPKARSEAPATPTAAESDTAAALQADYLNTIAVQRGEVAEASDVVQEFLLDPNSLDQRKRTQMLQAIATLHTNAEAAGTLEPPKGLESLHALHLESLKTLATAGALYTTGMDTHDPSQYDRANEALARGTELFDMVGAELEAHSPSE
jgi:hypothetical protein